MTEGIDEEQGTKRGSGRLAGFLSRTGVALALLAAVSAVAAGFGSRFGLWHFRTGFMILSWAAWGGLGAAVLSLGGVVAAVKQRRFRSGILSLVGLGAGIAIVAVPLSWKMTARSVPAIHDITTDIDHPPQFVAILPLRKDAPNPAEYAGGEAAVQQRAAYPDIKTVILNLPRQEAFDRSLDAARVLGWRIVAAVPEEGRIEATDTTRWFGFTDDIVIRVTPADYRSLVDIRSVSRVGRSDVGTNARRIREFIKRLTG